MIIEKSLGEKIQDVIASEIHRIVEKEAVAAGKRVEDEIKGMTGHICSRVLEHYEMEMIGSKLVIRVDFGKP